MSVARERAVSWGVPVGDGVVRVDLGLLADDLGCSIDDLVTGLRRKFSFHEAGGAGGLDAAARFGVGHAAPTPAVKEALVLATGTPLENGFPWELIVIGNSNGLTAIEVTILNLARAGLERVVVALAQRGREIRRAIESGPVNGRIWVEFVDFSDDFKGNDIDALVAVQHSFQGSFLLCGPGRIHRPSLVRRLADFSLPKSFAACVLIDLSHTDAAAGSSRSNGTSPLPPRPTPHASEAARDVRIWRRRGKPTAVAAIEEPKGGGTNSGIARRDKSPGNKTPAGADPQPFIDAGLYLITPQFLRILVRESGERKKPAAAGADAAEAAVAAAAAAVAPLQSFTAALVELAVRRKLACLTADGGAWMDLRPEGAAARAARIAMAERDMELHGGDEMDLEAEPGLGAGGLLDLDADASRLFPTIASRRSSTADETDSLKLNVPPDAHDKAKALEQPRRKPWDRFRKARRSLSFGGSTSAQSGQQPLLTGRGRFTTEGLLFNKLRLQPGPAGFLLTEPDGRATLSLRRWARPPFLPPEVELPSDIKQVAIETVMTDSGAVQVHVEVAKRVPILGWVLLVVALCGVSMAGPLGTLIKMRAPELNGMFTGLWRQTCTTIIYTPFFLNHLRAPGVRKQLHDSSLMVPSVVVGLCGAMWGLCFYSSLGFTSLANAVLFSHVTPIVLVLGKALMGGSVNRLEASGVLVAMVGAGVCTMLSHPHDQPTKARGTDAIGIGLATLASCSTALHLVFSKSVRHAVAISNYVWLVAAVPMAASTTFLTAATGHSLGLEALVTSQDGLYGWVTSAKLARLQIATSLCCDVIGSLGFFLALKYVSPIVVSVTCLLVPVVAIAEGLALGVGVVPNVAVAGGGLLILSGAAMVMASSMLPHTEQFDGTCELDAKTGSLKERLLEGTPKAEVGFKPSKLPFGWGRRALASKHNVEMRGRRESWEMLLPTSEDNGGRRGSYGSTNEAA